MMLQIREKRRSHSIHNVDIIVHSLEKININRPLPYNTYNRSIILKCIISMFLCLRDNITYCESVPCATAMLPLSHSGGKRKMSEPFVILSICIYLYDICLISYGQYLLTYFPLYRQFWIIFILHLVRLALLGMWECVYMCILVLQ